MKRKEKYATYLIRRNYLRNCIVSRQQLHTNAKQNKIDC